MRSYQDLIVWQKSVDLVTEIYKITTLFPKSEQFGLVVQMRRAAVSIVSNIAEGFARRTKKDNAHFVTIAYGSAAELEAQIIVAKRLAFIKVEEWGMADSLLNEILRMLNRLRESLSITSG